VLLFISYFTSFSFLLCIFVTLYITWFLNSRKYERLQVLEFSSSRKRMSVIVRNVEKQLLLLSKGADRLDSYAYMIYWYIYEVES
jgi:hypothetical protein